MKFEELIYKRLLNSEVAGKMASYAGVPAIFYSEVPSDNQEGWGDKTQYPRLCYWFDMQANQERNSAGTLTISLMCMNETEQLPEQMEPILRSCMKDILLTPHEENSSYCFAWGKTEAFSYQKQDGTRMSDGDLVVGCDIIFDILEYTNQETTDPDPIVAMNRYIKELYPEAIVLGWDKVEEIIEAGVETPVFYCRLLETEVDRETNTVVWLNGKIAIHFLCPDSSVRMKMTMGLANKLSLDGEVILLDKSPMFIEELSADYKADYFTEGQLKITGQYGLLRYQQAGKILRNTTITGGV
uniref:Uncharacterized protein n=1 Tax=Siphoviridae sp. ctdjo3 TaxID=2825583 RepID=A0A8S5PSH8_9CAUD|nr:MAG TPA: hypothetical protein [Siphoviridae sp. ctdjo3]